MSKFIFSVCFLFSLATSVGQNKKAAQPFILQGQIINSSIKRLVIFYAHENKVINPDTIQLDDEGKFFFKKQNLTVPVLARITIKNKNMQLYIAPGYNLKLTADDTDPRSFFTSKKISGIGSESNRYFSMIDSISVAQNDRKNWLGLNEANALQYIREKLKLRDSIASVIFTKKPSRDNYFSHFGKVSRLDSKFEELYMLVAYLNINVSDYSKYPEFLRSNFDNQILNDLYNDKYFLSPRYRDLMKGQFLNYLIKIDYWKDSSLRKQKDYDIEKISTTYIGNLREFALYSKMKASFTFSKSFSQLNDFKARFEPYRVFIQNPEYKNSIEERITLTEVDLKRTQIGNPAPPFTLESDKGEMFSLNDFKNKVVYLDLWASWCHPCREETPYLKLLEDKYKGRNDLVIIGISLDTDRARWKKALDDDKPTWLQLIDKDGSISSSYVANEIPQFVIIDKNGNIVNFDAPRPSATNKLEDILNQEISK